GRTFARIAAHGEGEFCVRFRDLAAPNGSRHASGTALPRRDDSGRAPLSPRLRREKCTRYDLDATSLSMTSYPDTARTGAARLCLSVALLSGAVAGLGPPAAAQVAGSTAQGVA